MISYSSKSSFLFGLLLLLCSFLSVNALTPPMLSMSAIRDSTGLVSTTPITQGVKMYVWSDITNTGETATTVTCKWLFGSDPVAVYVTSVIAAKQTTLQACRIGHIFPMIGASASTTITSYIASVSLTSIIPENAGTSPTIVSRSLGTRNYGTCTTYGVCMATSTCSSEFGLTPVAVECPGTAGITCCPLLPVTKSPCSSKGRSGTCVHSTSCPTATNTFESGVCLGSTASADSVQCCIPNAAAVTNSCSAIGGVCAAAGASCSSPNELVSGYCPGTSVCCVGKSSGFTCASRGGVCKDETLCNTETGSGKFTSTGMCPGPSANKCCTSCGPYTLAVNPPQWIASPNFDVGRTIPGSTTTNEQYSITFVVLHGTAGGGTVSWFQNPASSVSSHYVVELSGRVVKMVQESDTAWHNGVVTSNSAFYLNRFYCPLNAVGNPTGNLRSIGIEIERSTGNNNVMPEIQIQAVSALIRDIMSRRPGIELLVHNQFNVGRICPGSVFPLERFQKYTC